MLQKHFSLESNATSPCTDLHLSLKLMLQFNRWKNRYAAMYMIYILWLRLWQLIILRCNLDSLNFCIWRIWVNKVIPLHTSDHTTQTHFHLSMETMNHWVICRKRNYFSLSTIPHSILTECVLQCRGSTRGRTCISSLSRICYMVTEQNFNFSN